MARRPYRGRGRTSPSRARWWDLLMPNRCYCAFAVKRCTRTRTLRTWADRKAGQGRKKRCTTMTLWPEMGFEVWAISSHRSWERMEPVSPGPSPRVWDEPSLQLATAGPPVLNQPSTQFTGTDDCGEMSRLTFVPSGICLTGTSPVLPSAISLDSMAKLRASSPPSSPVLAAFIICLASARLLSVCSAS